MLFIFNPFEVVFHLNRKNQKQLYFSFGMPMKAKTQNLKRVGAEIPTERSDYREGV